MLLSPICFGQTAQTVTSQTPTVTAISPSALSFPIDFETGTYTFTDFSGGAATVIANPHSSGINTSAKVAQIVRNGGATWAGCKLILSSKLDFSATPTISMNVYSPRVGVTVLFKPEGDVAPSEVSTTTTVADEWETLTWDFTGKLSNAYDNLVFMFDFWNVGDGTANSTFLFDDVNLVKLTVGLQHPNASNKVAVYPNPAENNLYINSKSDISKVAV